jgi:hypothetical protein
MGVSGFVAGKVGWGGERMGYVRGVGGIVDSESRENMSWSGHVNSGCPRVSLVVPIIKTVRRCFSIGPWCGGVWFADIQPLRSTGLVGSSRACLWLGTHWGQRGSYLAGIL